MAPTILLLTINVIFCGYCAPLNTIGHELDIIEAPSGEEALLEASRRPIDLLVADCISAAPNGIELIHKITPAILKSEWSYHKHV